MLHERKLVGIFSIVFIATIAVLVGSPIWYMLDSVLYGFGAGVLSTAYTIPYRLDKERLLGTYSLRLVLLLNSAVITGVFALSCLVGFVVFLMGGTPVYELLLIGFLVAMVTRQCLRFLALEWACREEHPLR